MSLGKVLAILAAICFGVQGWLTKGAFRELSLVSDAESVDRILRTVPPASLRIATGFDCVFAALFFVLIFLLIGKAQLSKVAKVIFISGALGAMLADLSENVSVFRWLGNPSAGTADFLASIQPIKLTLYFIAVIALFVPWIGPWISARWKQPREVTPEEERKSRTKHSPAWLQFLADLGVLIRSMAAVIVPIAVYSLLMMKIPQVHEALRIAAEDKTPLATILPTLFLLSLLAWVWSRLLLWRILPLWRWRYVFKEANWRPHFYTHVPAILGAAPWFIFAAGSYMARLQESKLAGAGKEEVNGVLNQMGLVGIVCGILFLMWHFSGIGVVTRSQKSSPDSDKPSDTLDAPHTPNGPDTPNALDAPKTRKHESPKPATGIQRAAFLLTLISSLLFAVLTFYFAWSPTSVNWLATIACVQAGVAMWMAAAAALLFLAKRLDLPLFKIAFTFGVIFGALNCKDIRRVELMPRVGVAEKTVDGAFKDWLKGRPDGQSYTDAGKPYPVVIVCAEGGGIRAAYHATMALAALQDRWPNFAEHVFCISSVSGGSLGSAAFAAAISKDQGAKRADVAPFVPVSDIEATPLGDKLEKVYEQDLLSPVVGRMFFPDALHSAIPLPLRFQWCDRSKALADALRQGWKTAYEGDDTMGGPISGLYGGEFGDGAVPALFLNTSSVDGGDRLVLSNLVIPKADGSEFKGGRGYPVNPTDKDLALCDAATLSARFPIVTTSGEVPIAPPLRLVDGGYVENSGAGTGVEVLRTMINVRNEGGTPPFKVIFLMIGNSGPGKPAARVAEPPFNELVSPIQTVLSNYMLQNSIPSRHLPDDLKAIKKASGLDVELFKVQYHSGYVDLPLGWTLSKRAKSEIRIQVGARSMNGARLDADSRKLAEFNRGQISKLLGAMSNPKP